MSLKKKLSLGLFFVCFCLLVIGITNHLSIKRIKGDYEKLILQSVPKLGDISGMRARAAQAKGDAYKMILHIDNPKEFEDIKTSLTKNIKRYGEIENEYKERGFFSPAEEKQFELVNAESDQFLKGSEELLKIANTPSSDRATQLNDKLKSLEKVFADHQKDIKGLDDIIVSSSEEWSKSAEATAKSAETTGIVLGLISIIIVSIGIYFFSKQINFILSTIADRLNSSSSMVEQSTTQLNDVSTGLSSSSTEQAAALQETVAAATEVASMIKTTSDNSQLSLERAQKSHAAAAKGQNVVNDLIQSIDEISVSNKQISNQVEKSNEELNEIISLIDDINNKTKVINDIVFQTRILSFNASVEAARAGESGKGFSVVAEEVSKLASMSGKAAEEIRLLLDKSNVRVKEIVESSRENVNRFVLLGEDKVNKGIKRADGCKEVLNIISGEIEQMLAMSGQISDATREQSVGMEEINKALGQIEVGTNLNADSSQVCTQAANELSTQVKNSKEVVQELLQVIYGKEAA
jgi:methyl-accepting chemotaxis protein